tara:strand:+ start:65 stop:193 length:129 start_codon:yes stop_codon:yes gene_type:complete
MCLYVDRHVYTKEVYMNELNQKLEEAYIVIAMLQAKLAETKK